LWRYKGYRLPQDLGLLGFVFVLLLYYSLLVRLRPLPWILAKISSRSGTMRGDREVLDKIWRGSGFLLKRFFLTDKPCLRRTLVLYRWCRQNGIEARVVVGVRKEDKGIKGHSWLLVDGRPYREDEKELKQYVSVMEG
jgi:hypothetical protein